MNTEFFLALDEIEKDKGIPKAYMLEKINQALLAAVRKDNPAAAEGVRVEIDDKKRSIRIYIEKTVVEEVSNPAWSLPWSRPGPYPPPPSWATSLNLTWKQKNLAA
jgi:hypothetical protein